MTVRTFKAAVRATGKCLPLPAELGRHSATVIVLHHQYDTIDRLGGKEALQWKKALPHIKFLLPEAPLTLEEPHKGLVWYNQKGFDDFGNPDPYDGLEDSITQINMLITSEVKAGLPRSRILLAGFSQGAAMALHAGLSPPRIPNKLEFTEANYGPLAGVLAIAGFLPFHDKFRFHEPYSSVPLLHCHSENDPMVPVAAARELADTLVNDFGMTNHTLKTFPHAGFHNQQMLDAGTAFIASCLPHDEAFIIPPKQPSKMSVKELKMLIAQHGQAQDTKGLLEKHEFVKVVEDLYTEHGIKI